jgi:sn1-specific diacylglycerol lipase
MPSLRIFGRKTIFAGDDLQPTAMLTTLARAFQGILFLLPVLYYITRDLGIFIQYNQSHGEDNGGADGGKSHFYQFLLGGDLYPNECDPKAHYFPMLVYVYLMITCIHIISSIWTEQKIIKIANLGTPTQSELRKSLSSIVERKWIWSSMVGNGILLTMAMIPLVAFREEYFECHDYIVGDIDNNDDDDTIYMGLFSRIFGKNAWLIMYLLLLISQGIEFFASSYALILLLQKERDMTCLSTGDFSYYDTRFQQHPHHHELAEEMWDTRCKTFCRCAAFSTCYLFGGRELVDGVVGDYGQISRALADFFEDGGVLDLVPSDLAAGFGMLQRVQRQRILEARKNVLQEMNGTNVMDASVSSSLLRFSTKQMNVVSPREEECAIMTNEHSLMSEKPGSWNISASDSKASVVDMTSSSARHTLLVDDNASVSTTDSSTHALTIKMQSEDTKDGSKHWYEAVDRKVFNKNEDCDRQLIAEGARFARHALSIYTWLLYVYMNPISCFPRLFYDRISECFKKKQASMFHHTELFDERSLCFDISHGNTVGDNFLHLHRNALIAHSGLDETDLIYANFNNSYNQMPYSIVIDHKWRSVVISIRGTLSLEDCVVDTLLDPEPLDELGRQYGFDASGQFCHGGVLACVKWIMKDMERHRIIESLLSDIGALYSHYTLRITGHSLGAGCATLIGYIYRQKYPSLRVIAISPPGSFLTWRLATQSNEFVTSFVLDSDLVPRLTVHSMEHLRNEVLNIFGRIKVPKSHVAKNFILNSIIRAHEDDSIDSNDLAKINDEILYSEDCPVLDSDFHLQYKRFQDIQNARKESRGENREIKLYPPGKIVQLVKVRKDLIFNCIFLSLKYLIFS